MADSVICYFIVHGRTGGTESGKYWGRIYFRKYCDLPSVLDDGVYAGSKYFLFGIGGHAGYVHIFRSKFVCAFVSWFAYRAGRFSCDGNG